MLLVWSANSDGSYSKPTLYMNNKMASQKASELIDYIFSFLFSTCKMFKYLFIYVFIYLFIYLLTGPSVYCGCDAAADSVSMERAIDCVPVS